VTGLPADLGDGLVLRRGRPEDAGPLQDLAVEVFREEDGSVDEPVVAWMGELLDGSHPVVTPDLFTIVEDTGNREIVSTLCLIPQEWAYSGIPFGVGRVELVGTREAYRRRGLIRRQMDAVHAWSAGRGHLAQAITGIPWFYRQFGYDMAVDLGGGRSCRADALPLAPDPDPWVVRPATAGDAGEIARIYDDGMERYLVTCRRSAGVWAFELGGRAPGSAWSRPHLVVERDGRTAGVATYHRFSSDTVWLTLCEIDPSAGWRDGTLAVLRHLTGLLGEGERSRFTLRLAHGAVHPGAAALPDVLTETRRPYAWYIRVADLPAFLRRVAPVLEWNLSESPFAGHNGTLRINTYHGGFWIRLEDGALADAGELAPMHPEDGDAAFPDHSFLQLLFGRRSMDRLLEARPDCRAKDDAVAGLLDALFPEAPSFVFALA
jgi:GNAT superfamily N-acetyltransferase